MVFPVTNREYTIITKIQINHKIHIEKYTGKCIGGYNRGIHWIFFDVSRVKSPYHVKHSKIFTIDDEFCDMRQIKLINERAKNARHDMEKRALDLILKRLINEHFEWY